MEAQATPAAVHARRRFFYGWWLMIAGLAMSVVNGALYSYGFSAYFRPLISEFGWTRTELAGVISISRLENGIVGPIAGYFIDRLGPRRVMLAGVLIVAAGFFLLSRAEDFVGFTLAYVLVLSTGSSFGTIAPVQTALANWFIRRRSLVLGLLFAGIAMGGFLVPLVNLMIEGYTWRGAALTSAVIFLAVGVPVALAMRHRPEDHGYLPDGDPPHADTPEREAAGDRPAAAALEADFTPREALRTRAFWLIAFAWMLWSMLPAIITVHLIIYFTDVGFPPQVAANVFGIYAFVSGASRIVVGWTGDRVNKRYLLTALWSAQVVGLFFLSRVHGLWDVVPFIAIFAPAYGGVVPLRGALQADYFGRKHFATISGLIRVVDLAGTVAGPVAVAWAFDNAGGVEGYRLAFQVIGVVNILGALAVLAALPPARRRKAPAGAVVPT